MAFVFAIFFFAILGGAILGTVLGVITAVGYLVLGAVFKLIGRLVRSLLPRTS